MDRMSLPVACNLMDSELQERRRTVLQKVRSVVSEVKEIEHGYIYRFPSDGTWIRELADMVHLEHQCCPFLKFNHRRAGRWPNLVRNDRARGYERVSR